MALFNAKFACSGESDGVLMAGLADDRHDSVNYLLFQKTINPDAQDIEQGHDQVHVTLNGGAFSCYGGIERVSLASNGLEVRVDSHTAEVMGTTQRLVVSFEHHLDGLDELSVMLEKIFDSLFDKRDMFIHAN